MSIEIPEHLRNGPLAEAARKSLADAASMAASSNSVPRISLRGREFRLVESGEEIAKFRDELDVIILGVEPGPGRMIKTFYKGGYTSGAKEPPTCSSDDGIAPASWVNEKQSPQCGTCPKNVFGSAKGPSGKPTKACRDSKRIWVKLADTNKVGDKVYDPGPFDDRITFGVGITVASLKAFSDHGKLLDSLGQGPSVCVTTLVMQDMEYPQLDFKLKSWLGPEEAPKALAIAERRPWKMHANVGLALAAPDGNKSSLPTSLPGVPAHLQQTSDANIVEAVPTKPVGNIDDAIGKW